MGCQDAFASRTGRRRIQTLVTLFTFGVTLQASLAQDVARDTQPAHIHEFRLPELKRHTTQDILSLVEGLSQVDAELSLVVGQARLMRLKRPLAQADQQANISVADPTVLDLQPLADGRSLRLLGLRPGSTEFTLTLGDDSHYGFRVDVTYDLEFLNRRLEQLFPTALIKATQLKDHLVLEGQSRSISQVSDIIRTTEAYMAAAVSTIQAPSASPVLGDGEQGQAATPTRSSAPTVTAPQIINLLRIPESPQVLLKVQVAELNRTALRRIGTDLLFSHGGQTLGTQIGGAFTMTGNSTANATSLVSLITGAP
ncbi:MAG: pilus assembly protein N-terminal domain-containing protein, partial [Planctomycetaceae bacterium]